MLPPPDVLYSHNRHRLGILRPYNTYFVTVSAPVDQFKALGLRPLIAASETTGNMLTKEDIVIYESTVYPGCADPDLRSEEHTSELQSLMRISYAVFCSKKKKKH